jgi:hypothetical protein
MSAGRGRYRISYVGPSVGSGITDGRLGSVPAIVKTNGDNAPYCVANEVACGEIGRFLGLPVPLGGVCYSPTSNPKLFYASLDFNLPGRILPPTNVTTCVKQLPRLSSGVLLFDILIGNCDRHGRNISVDFSTKPPNMNIFDHGHALFGKDRCQGVERLERLRERLAISGGSRTQGNRHCFLDQIETDEHFGYWLDRIRRIPDFLMDDIIEELPTLGCTDKESAAAREFLRYRRISLEHIIEENKQEFSRIMTWRLFR